MAVKEIPFSKKQLEEIIKNFPTPFHIYDEKGMRETPRYFKNEIIRNEEFKE